MSEYTPGNWIGKVNGRWFRDDGWSAPYSDEGCSSAIAIGDRLGDVIAYACLTTDRSDAELEANARLIAAAPELLEALEEAVFWDSHDEGDVPAVWLDKAKAAIAKARGEENE